MARRSEAGHPDVPLAEMREATPAEMAVVRRNGLEALAEVLRRKRPGHLIEYECPICGIWHERCPQKIRK